MNIIEQLRRWLGASSEPCGGSCCGGCGASSAPMDVMKALDISDNDVSAFRAMDERIVVGVVHEVKPHPDPKMTKVQVTRTEVAPGEVVTILCGAPNVKPGIVVPVAKVGAVLGKDFTIGQRDIRGVVSSGMICARRELGLDDPVDTGIWELSQSLKSRLGTPMREL